jgi:hypothetical protein
MTSFRQRDNENPVQLFPFVAVLLCTMGALLVLLVTIARSSKARALEEAAELQAQARAAAVVQAAESKEQAEASRRELERILAFQREIDAARRKADEVLQQDRARMAHLEDHMRRLRQELETMQLAAAELNSLETARFDDRNQAKQEIERLQELIDETRDKIERMRAEANRRAKSYAIVPYQSRSGTRRRPVYIECREKDAVLQPEGIVFTLDDFRPPIGPGNPLVAALRAAREQIGRTEPADAQGNAAVSYPLIIVRPAGVEFYYHVREAIQSWDSEFGYELVEEDWDLKYGAADPRLAAVEYEAAEAARERLQSLARAAPQAYGAYRFGGDAGDNWGGDSSDGEGDGSFGTGGGNGSGTRSGRGVVGGQSGTSRPGGGRIAAVIVKREDSKGRDDSNSSAGEARSGEIKDRSGTTNNGPSDSRTQQKDANQSPAGQANSAQTINSGAQGQPSQNGSPTDTSQDNRSYSGGNSPQRQHEMRSNDRTSDLAGDPQQSKQKIRGKNWAIRNANQSQIPIRRTIQIEVRGDALAILPEASSTNSAAAAGREYPFRELPIAAYEDLLSAVDKRIEDWGMAGQGLYWRPVIELRVGADGDRRVDDLVRLLEHGGAEIRGESMAQQANGGANGTTQ